MSAPPRHPLGQLGLLPLELRVQIYELAIISAGPLIHVTPSGDLQPATSLHPRPLERLYAIQTASASIGREINRLHLPSRVCTFVVAQPRSFEALLTKTTCGVSGIRNLEIRSSYCVLCRQGVWERYGDVRAGMEEMAVGRLSYRVWERGFEMLGARVRRVRIDVTDDLACVSNRRAIRKRIVKLAAMAAKATGGRVRISVEAGCLGGSEQRFLEEGVLGVVPRRLGWPCETFGGGKVKEEQVNAEVPLVKEVLSLDGLNELMDENVERGIDKVC